MVGQFVMLPIRRDSAPHVKRHSALIFQPNERMDTIGSRMKAKRLEMNMTQAALGALVGLAKSTIRDIELGKSKSSTKLHSIADALGVYVNWLETGRGEMNASGSQGAILHTSFTPLDATTLTRAMYWVEIEEDAIGVAYQPVRRAERIIATYGVLAANGGDLTADQIIDLVESANQKRKGVMDGDERAATTRRR